MAVHLAMMGAALCALAFLAGGCAATATIALGEHARAAIAQPVCLPLGERTVVTVDRDGKVGPDDVVTTTVTEPAPPPPAHEAQGAKISETAGGVLRTALGFVWSGVKWFFGVP